ncbi:dnaJ homolog subfamily C member 27, partial [Pyrgilauda ruficollis]|uniref:dnaJ homolog subfamily C member 27 n=1 Tax=Pyrgilauda ruficollis TaxID=221976 RepID=UPI001B8683BB
VPNEFYRDTQVLVHHVRNEFYRDTQGVLLVYDVGSKDSFEALDSWLAEMRRELGPHGSLDNVVFAVCANKVDAGKLRVVDESEGRLWAESRGFLYWETSAQSGEGIQEMFQNFYSAIVDLCENGGKRPPGGSGISFTREQADAIRRIRSSKDSWDALGLKPGASRCGGRRKNGNSPWEKGGIPPGKSGKKPAEFRWEKNFYSAIVDLCENGGKRPPGGSGISFTREQADAIRRIRSSKDSWDALGLKPGAS